MNTYQYDLVKKLSFSRFGGTEGELRAAKLLLKEIEELGGAAGLEEFDIPASVIKSYSVKVVYPYERELEVLPFGLSGSLPKDGVNLKLFYGEDCSPAALYGITDLSEYAVLVNGLNIDQYKALCEKKAAAILVISGKWYDTKETSDFLPLNLRPPYLAFGKIPTFFIRAKDAAEIVKNEAKELNLRLEQEETHNISHNLVATVKGREIPGESIAITAHYDSVLLGTGSYDNATGAATAMYIYRHFLKNPPKRSLRFIWCGSEEQGLLGSKAYTEAHKELIENEIKLCFNFDMCGTILGVNSVGVTGDESLSSYAEAFLREYGLNGAVKRDVRSSDSAVFADAGIPTLDIIRRTATADIHTRHDLIDSLSPLQLKKDGDFAIAFIERVIGSARMPVEKNIPADMKEKLDKYFLRDKLPENKE